MSANARADKTDAVAYMEEAKRGRLEDLADLFALIDGENSVDEIRREELGVSSFHYDEGDQANDRIHEYPLGVEATTTFHILLGSGGPDDRLLIECDTGGNRRWDDRDHAPYEVRRILYRYSWSGSAERELVGEDFTLAERFARTVVPELVE